MASIRDVAKRAGVSTSTVSVVLNDTDKFVSEDHRQRVLSAAVELGYRLPPKKRFTLKTIAVILPVVTSSFFSNVFNGIEESISPDDNLLLYYNSNYNFEKEKACIETLKKQHLAGVILDSVCPPEKEMDYLCYIRKEFTDRGIPVVMLERNREPVHFHSVYIDNYKGAYQATQHLIEKGHTSIAHISGNGKLLHSQERFEGYRQALLDYGVSYSDELVVRGDFTPHSGYAAIRELLIKGIRFTALFSANDQMAIGAMKALKNSGRRIPKDIAIAGFDDLSVASLIEPALTTIHVPTYQMGRVAANIILNVSDGREVSMKNELETNLIVRRSSDEEAMNEWELFGW